MDKYNAAAAQRITRLYHLGMITESAMLVGLADLLLKMRREVKNAIDG